MEKINVKFENEVFIYELKEPKQELENYENNLLNNIRKNRKLKGYRDGKAPLNLIKNIFRDEIEERIKDYVISEAYKYIRDVELKSILTYNVLEYKRDSSGDIVLKIEIEVSPEINLSFIKDIKLKKMDNNISDKEIEEQLNLLKEKFARFYPKEGAIAENDFVNLDIISFDNGKENRLEKYNLFITLNGDLKEFHQHLIGLKKDEHKEFEIYYPEDFSNEKLRNKRIKYKVKINSIKERHLPKLDDEFAKQFPNINSFQELRAKITEELRVRKVQENRQKLINEVFDKIIERQEVKIPKRYFEMMKSIYLRNLKEKFNKLKMNVEEDKEEFNKMVDENITRQIKIEFIKNAIIKENNIKVSDEEITEYMNKLSKEDMDKFGSREELIHELEDNLLYRKVEEFLVNTISLI